MLNIGPHISIAKGFSKAAETAVEIGANTFQFFTRNPRGGNAKKIEGKDVEKLEKIIVENDFAPILAHAPYTLNLCSDKEEIREFAENTMADDFLRVEKIGCKLYNLHPGNHLGQGSQAAIKMIIDALNRIINPDFKFMILLETMSGKGTEVGYKFEELREIIDGVELNDKIGICLDTCHVFSAGYDIVNNLDGVLEELDRVIGLGRLKAIHLNDSMKPFGDRKDRHALIGKGEIGSEALIRLINHEKLKKLPFFLETPTDEKGHAQEIEFLKSNYSE